MSQGLYQTQNNKFMIHHLVKGLQFLPHFHQNVELVYIFEGGTTALVDTNEYILRSGDLLVVFPFQIHAFRDDLENTRRILMIYSLDNFPLFRNLMSTFTPTSPVLHNIHQSHELLNLLLMLDQHQKEKGKFKKEILNSYLTVFNGVLLRCLDLKPIANKEFTTIHTILSYCAAHYREPLTTSSVAKALYTHRNYVSTVFSQHLHTSFNDYIHQLRITNACHLLNNTNDTITSISLAVGYESLRTFNRAFQHVCGITPSEYRKKSKKKYLQIDH